jgi:hypothetical protein
MDKDKTLYNIFHFHGIRYCMRCNKTQQCKCEDIRAYDFEFIFELCSDCKHELAEIKQDFYDKLNKESINGNINS